MCKMTNDENLADSNGVFVYAISLSEEKVPILTNSEQTKPPYRYGTHAHKWPVKGVRIVCECLCARYKASKIHEY